MLRFELGHARLGGIDLRLEWRLLELVEQVALGDLRALDEQSFFEKGADARDKVHPAHGLNSADKLVGLGNLLSFGANDPNRRWRAGGHLCLSRPRNQAGGNDERHAFCRRYTQHRSSPVLFRADRTLV